MNSGNIFSHYTLSFEKGEIIYRQGEDGQSMFVIKSGVVALAKEVRGKKEVVAELEKGDFFGELSILEHSKRREMAIAKAPCTLVVIHRGTFVKMLKANMEIAIRMLQKLTSKLRRQEDQIEELYQRVRLDGVTPDQAQKTMAGEHVQKEEVTAKLISLSSNRLFMLESDENLIGRYDPVTGIKPEVDLTNEDDSRSVSRRHAFIKRRDGKFYLQEEMGVLNGTFLNGTKATADGELEISSGDTINFGMLAFKCWIGEDGPPPES